MTESYRVFLKKSAVKEPRSIPPKDVSRIVEKIRRLAAQPRPSGCEKLEGEERFRIRQGDWRAVYSVDDDGKTVTVFKIGNRREVYR